MNRVGGLMLILILFGGCAEGMEVWDPPRNEIALEENKYQVEVGMIIESPADAYQWLQISASKLCPEGHDEISNSTERREDNVLWFIKIIECK